MMNSRYAERLDCAGKSLDLSQPYLMGVLNVTPDSFSDGANYYRDSRLDIDLALARAEQMVIDGATIIDVGGESTRPGAEPVTAQQEIDRVIPVIEALSSRIDAIISVDTSTAQVMQESARVGAGLINDVRSLSRPDALAVAAATGLPVCLMHMQGQPQTMQAAPKYTSVVAEVYGYLEERVKACVKAGIPAHKILVDPGFGFGKKLEHNLELLRKLDVFGELGVATAVGISRKSMLGELTGRSVDERVYGSVAAAVIAVLKGARVVRCHDVAETRDAIQVAHAVVQK